MATKIHNKDTGTHYKIRHRTTYPDENGNVVGNWKPERRK